MFIRLGNGMTRRRSFLLLESKEFHSMPKASFPHEKKRDCSRDSDTPLLTAGFFIGGRRARRLNVLNGLSPINRECPEQTTRSESRARDRLAWRARRLCPPPRGT